MAQMDRQERPSIHVTLLTGVDAGAYRWVRIGAEEEGVPCRQIASAGNDVVANAFAAAQSSRFNVGVAVSPHRVVLHESHMPPAQPVLTFDDADDLAQLARLMGCNAARMIIRKPFRFAEDIEEVVETAVPPPPPPPIAKPAPPAVDNEFDLDPAQLKALVTVVVRKLLERGVQ